MDDRPKKVKKTRISVTLTKPYLDALDRLVEEGVYLSRGEIILEAPLPSLWDGAVRQGGWE
jgi:hypothetical protein